MPTHRPLSLTPLHWPMPAPGCGGIRQPAVAAERLAGVALRLGIDGLRAPLLALRLARVIAALRGHAGVRREDDPALPPNWPSPTARRSCPRPRHPRPPRRPMRRSQIRRTARPRPDRSICRKRCCLRPSAPPCPPTFWTGWPPPARPAPGRAAAGSGEARTGNRRGAPCPRAPASPRPGIGSTWSPPCAPPPPGRRSAGQGADCAHHGGPAGLPQDRRLHIRPSTCASGGTRIGPSGS